MAKNIVLSSDGTGNRGGKDRGTNVWKLHLAVDRHDHESRRPPVPQQLAFYDDGVGTSDMRLPKILAGAVGWGLGRNIRQLYTALARNYTPGDAIYLFGFSRGAYTVRSLAGMIATIGVIDANEVELPQRLESWVDDAYAAYRKRPLFGADPVRNFKARCTNKGITLRDVSIRFIGVWDTVDAVGVPFDGLRHLIYKLSFLRREHSHQLTSNVAHACHAMAIDDKRATFAPLMWNPQATPHATVEQVWFAGVHSNVGGGYPKQGMATVALYWMMKKACQQGLRVIPAALNAAHDEANVDSKLYDSRSGLAAYYRYRPRNIAKLHADSNTRPQIHVTALDRIARATDFYAPTNLPIDFDIVSTDGDDPQKTWIRDRIARYKSQLDLPHSRDVRKAAEPEIARVTRQRQLLYGGFLILSWMFVWALLTFGFREAWSMTLLATWSESLRPVLGWADPVVGFLLRFAGGILSTTVGLALPSILDQPIRSLDEVSELTALLLLVALLLLWRRQSLIRKMSAIGADMWRTGLGDAR